MPDPNPLNALQLNTTLRLPPGICIALLCATAIACLWMPAPVRGAEAPHQRFDLDITRAAVAAGQRVLRVRQNDRVQLNITSDAPGEIHLHGYRQAAAVVPGRATQIAFEAHATGRYRIEWHPTSTQAQAGHAHGPALATLEVRPR